MCTNWYTLKETEMLGGGASEMSERNCELRNLYQNFFLCLLKDKGSSKRG